MLIIGKKPTGRSTMISNATNPLKESREESLLSCAGCTSICVWLVCDLVVMCAQAVGDRALGDLCVVSEGQKASLLDSRPCCWLKVISRCARLECMRLPLVTGKQQ